MAALSWGVSAAAAQSLPEMRMTPAEIRASALDSNQIGSSAVPRVHKKVIFGDPAKRASAPSYCSCPLTPPSRRTRIATIVWPLSAPASGTLATAIISMRNC